MTEPCLTSQQPITNRDEFAEFIASSDMTSCFALMSEAIRPQQIRIIGVNQTPGFMANVFGALGMYGYAAHMAATLETLGFTVLPPREGGARPNRAERRRMGSGRR